MVSLNVRGPTPAPDVSKLKGEALKEAIKDWFLSNFEDPAENTPYESAEGGYQYIWGGPYDANEELYDNFPNVPEEIIEGIVDELQETAIDWAPNSNRVFDEDDVDYEEDISPSPYEKLQIQLDNVDAAIQSVEPLSSLIGDNKPPEDIGVPPYGDEDKKEIKLALEILRKPEEELSQQPAVATAAAEVFRTRGERLKEFLERHGEKFSEGFSSQLGKRAADSAILAAWLALSGSLLAAYEAVKAFLSSLASVPNIPL